MPEIEKLLYDDVDAIEKKHRVIFNLDCYETFRLSGQEARRWDANYVGTEHLLLALAVVGNRKLFYNYGVLFHEVRPLVEKILTEFHSVAFTRDMGFTPRSKQALELAAAEAKKIEKEVNRAHLLQGLATEGEGVAAVALKRLGFRTEPEASQPKVATHPRPPEPEKMVPKYSDAALQVLAYAKGASIQFGHKYICSEHLLLGLTKIPQLQPSLDKLNCTEDKVRDAIEKILGHGNREVGLWSFSPNAKAILAEAERMPESIKAPVVQSTHILKGILSHRRGIAVSIIEAMGVPKSQFQEIFWSIKVPLYDFPMGSGVRAEPVDPSILKAVYPGLYPDQEKRLVEVVQLDPEMLNDLSFNSKQHYEWFMARLSETDRLTVRQEIKRRAARTVLDIYDELNMPSRSSDEVLSLSRRLDALLKNFQGERLT